MVRPLWNTPPVPPSPGEEPPGRARSKEEIEELNVDQRRRIKAWTEPAPDEDAR
jgi:hypothetical protein